MALPAGVTDATSLVSQANQGESVEWVNMCIRKVSLRAGRARASEPQGRAGETV